jgi:hypothetical protein
MEEPVGLPPAPEPDEESQEAPSAVEIPTPVAQQKGFLA